MIITSSLLLEIVFHCVFKFYAWKQSYDPYNDCAIWVNQTTEEMVYEKPYPPLSPLLPASMINKTTCNPLSLDEIRQNEADTSSSDDDDSKRSDFDDGGQPQPSPLPPNGRDGELELAEKRVKEMMKIRK